MPLPDPEGLIKRALADDVPVPSVLLALVDRDTSKILIPEGQHLDFKQALYFENNRDLGELGKDILGFSNAEGGLIIAGVDDNGVVVGHDPLDSRKLRESVGPWIGTRVSFEVGNGAVKVEGRSLSIGYILVRRTT